MTIVKNSCIAYCKLAGKILDKLFAINIDPFRMDLLYFLLAKFFLINLCDRSNNETVDNIAYNSCCLNGSSLNLIKEEELNLNKNLYQDIFKFFNTITSINSLSTLNIRTFIENWTRMYGESTLLALDYLPSFLSFIYGTAINANIAKDYIVENTAGKAILESYIEFGKLLK